MRKNLFLIATFSITILSVLSVILSASRIYKQDGFLLFVHAILLLLILALGFSTLCLGKKAAAQVKKSENRILTHAEEQLRINKEEYSIAVRHSSKHIMRLDIGTKTAYLESKMPASFNMPAVMENVPQSLISAGIIAPDCVDALMSFFDAIYRGDREGSTVISVLDTVSGEYNWNRYDYTTVYDDNNTPAQSIIAFYDITLQRQKELAYQRWQQSFTAAPKSATYYYEYNLTTDTFEHAEGGMLPPLPETVPRKMAELSAYFAKHYVFREDYKRWLEFMNRDRLLERYAAGINTDKTEFRRRIGDTPMWTALNIQMIPDPYSPDVKVYILMEDIDEHKRAEIYLQERSTLDSLTGLLNRGAFIDKLGDMLKASVPGTQHALIMLDIDNFKMINDTLGHSAGDALLVSIAGKLKYALRSDDLCGRLGGDEFVICLKNMNLGKSLEARVNDLCSLISDEHTWGVAVTSSFGISGFPYDGKTFDELYEKADIALYKAKAQGRGGYAVYDPQLSFDDLSLTVKH